MPLSTLTQPPSSQTMTKPAFEPVLPALPAYLEIRVHIARVLAVSRRQWWP